ncbi:hypothetical protein AWENTII_006192 [Aspergillus wentii]
MPPPQPSSISGRRSQHNGHSASTAGPARPGTMAPETTQESRSDSKSGTSKSAKRRKNRNRKRRTRRQSFLAAEEPHAGAASVPGPDTETTAPLAANHPTTPFYKLGRRLSNTSLESEALLDHRNQPMIPPRRDSRLAQSFRPGSSSTPFRSGDGGSLNPLSAMRNNNTGNDSDDSEAVDDRTPLMRPSSGHTSNLPRYGADSRSSPYPSRPRPASVHTISSRCSPRHNSPMIPEPDRDYDINNPPSMPTSPKVGPEMGYDDAVVTGAEFDFSLARSVENRRGSISLPHDMVIDMDGDETQHSHSDPPSPSSSRPGLQDSLRRRRTVAFPVEEDVCLPIAEPSEMAEEDMPQVSRDGSRRRRRHRQWPDLSILDEWSREEKEDRHGDFRTKQISEPMLIEGRLRPQYRTWRREEDEVPYRFTYFNEEFDSTIHAQTISELVQPGGSFRDLFIPEPPELEDSSDEDDVETDHPIRESTLGTDIHSNGIKTPSNGTYAANHHYNMKNNNGSYDIKSNHTPTENKQQPRAHSIISEAVSDARVSEARLSAEMPAFKEQQQSKPKRYGPRPAFWLDVLCPTDAEMRVIAKAFGIHALTAEDIMMQEAREKVELFRNYYFVNYRTFEQDPSSENYLQPVNMYVVVFREGVISFHFSQTPHPANVRRRIRQLMDYLILSSDWISYALIDDITDVFGPLIQAIEDEVDEIDENIMHMHSLGRTATSSNKEEGNDGVSTSLTPGEMLRRVGESRKKVMGMYRLLSNKADVVKGFAKRCNEQWEVAPKSEIGLYLGDIQDHIMTMTSSLTYYETILSRAHSNYLAQINILMNERQEQTADVLGKLTVLGTIVLPLNIICGMWGMNVKVPGQDVDSLDWFWSITAGLILFAIASFYIAKRVYKIV